MKRENHWTWLARELYYNHLVKCHESIEFVSELGKVEERLGIDMNLYLSPRKAETGLDSNKLPQEPRECTPVEIRSSVVEAGRCSCGDMAALSSNWEAIRLD